MIRPKITFILIPLVWLFSVVAFSQEKKPLKVVLAAIEKQHKVKFNYTEETVSDLEVTPPERKLTLIQKLEALQTEAPLAFELVNNLYIVITRTHPEKIPEEENQMAADLNEVVIESFLATGISKKKYGDVVIKPQQFGILPGLTEPDVLHTMQQIPGIYSADETISNINVRGGTHDQNLFLWNGIRMFQTGHFFGLISAFDPALAHTISISKNGSPAFYGESVSSVVDISTHTDDIEKTQFGIGANMIGANFFAKVKASKKASFVVSARRSYTDEIQTPTYQNYYNRIFQNTIVTKVDNNQIVDYRTNENFFFYDGTFQYRQKIGSQHEFFIDGIGIKNRLGINQNATVDGIVNSKYSALEQQSFGSSLNWKTVWNTANFTKINAYVSSYKLDALNQSVENNQILDQQNKVLDYGLRIENHHQINAFWAFNNGYQFNETGVSNFDEINNPFLKRRITEVLRTHALILETEYASATKDALFKGGVRTNYIEELQKWIVEPRLQFNYTLSKTLKVEILGEQKSQTMAQVVDLQRDFLGIEKRRWTVAGDEVPVQKSSQVSVGVSYKDNAWRIAIDNFYKKVTGISSPGQAFQNQLELLRINGDYTVAGTELLIQRNFEHFYSWLGYSFNRNEYRFGSFDPTRFPNNYELQHSVSAAAVYEKERLKIALGGKWNSGRPTTVPLSYSGFTITYNDPNKRYLEDYLQFNLSASYYWNLGQKTKLQANASVLNLLNKENVINRYYRVNTTANDIEVVNTYSMERTPNLSLRLTF
ncbi:TonB-dependent receptor plug domain-containing protein [Flavobacterium sp.]|uniref:TonB-dependent receptor plug domain-containing protein n=1 Tax=Flavobacterium sp. TaxID=239 RepID=UPI0039E72326